MNPHSAWYLGHWQKMMNYIDTGMWDIVLSMFMIQIWKNESRNKWTTQLNVLIWVTTRY